MTSQEKLNSFLFTFFEKNGYKEAKEKWASFEVQKQLKEILSVKKIKNSLAYNLFRKERKAKLALKYPEKTRAELDLIAREDWKNRYNTPELRKKWQDRADKLNSEKLSENRKEIEDVEMLENIKRSCLLLDFVKTLKPRLQKKYPDLGIKDIVIKIDNLWKYFKN